MITFEDNKHDRGSLIRTGVLVLALINQGLLALNLNPIPGTETLWGEVISAGITIVSAGVAWFKNNYITWKGRKQKKVLKQHNLTK
ncbi:holin [Lentibacillus populi]|uniref:Holin n=1 Tax=Lentibacillus populi TaxID=1827502 RepID=A0A9W5U1C8_9BACI|nr:phage holin [Lentibacillus populi]GGB56917.1 holin [Lentibacillus populi]